MNGILEVRLSQEQMKEIAEMVCERLERAKKFNRPLNLSEAARRLGVSVATVSRRVAAGHIRTVQGIGCPRIPEEEIRRLLDGESIPQP